MIKHNTTNHEKGPFYYKFIWVVTDEFGSWRKAFPTKKDAMEYCFNHPDNGKVIEKYQRVEQ